MATPLDNDVTALARRIAELGAGEKSRVFQMSWWSERMLSWAMAHPEFKTQLFRFVDVFPATTDDADVLRHVHEYFQGADAPRLLRMGVDVAERVPFGDDITASVARRNISRMAEQFIVGSTPDEAVSGLHRLWRQGSAFTVDLLGEKTVTEGEADRYAARVRELMLVLADQTGRWAPDDHLEFDDAGPIPRVNISIKPTALASLYAPLTRDAGIEQAATRLRPLLRLAVEHGVFVYFDMENYDVKDLTIELFRRLLDEPEFECLDAGIVIQAYLKDSAPDLADLVTWSSPRTKPITIRLVKGAYWDAETITAAAEGWPSPVFEQKAQTDANYERCVRVLHDHHGEVKAAFASHNLRSLAYAITYARHKGIPDSGYEIQMLYGMAEPIHAAIRRLGQRLRVYAPVGELVPGMAYLVRRLLENTSNESFVRHRFAEARSLDELIAPPVTDQIPPPPGAVQRHDTDPDDPGPYHHEPPSEFRRTDVREAFAAAIEKAAPHGDGEEAPAVIDGERFMTSATIESVDPARPSVVIGRSAACSPADGDRAVAGAVAAFERWRRTPVRDRAAVLFRAAAWFRARRNELAALEVFEAGKPWKEADADICEAIDFCEYYARQMLLLDEGGPVLSPPGESNQLRYQPRGVTVVISPWNFPLAIPTGMVVAALVAGNPVVFKPAEQTPVTAYRLVQALEDSGLPPGVLQFVPGVGEEVGAHLVEHPDVATIVFTGSKAVGLAITEAAARHRPGQRQVKRVIAEMGGKNPLIIDADADLDQAIPAAVYSAFGYAGQKCSAASRLIVLDAVHDEVVRRLVGAAEQVAVGHPKHMHTLVGPVIDRDAHQRIGSYIDLARTEGTVAYERPVPGDGWFHGPTVVTGVHPTSRVASEEIFGPVLSVLRVAHFDDALAVANETEYALTAGLISRSPEHIQRAAAELRGGNVYINRGTTGAVPGRQPFGGYGLSGVGSKAGGPDYLLQFLDPRVVTENTLRQGFAPDLPASRAGAHGL